jgi:4-diphosphocytidyl-2-C-methyl-D-erythritol kinase
MHKSMTVTVRSFAKINIGLCIGAPRADGFHDLRTVYQTIGLHDRIRVGVRRGSGIEIRCEDPRVPTDQSNTCYRIAERTMAAMKARGKILIEIEKCLPVQGGLGGASSNAIATLLALERVFQRHLAGEEQVRIAAEVGSDLPLFLIGGTVLGVGRGEEVYPLPDLPSIPCVIATPEIGVSTPRAFRDWDASRGASASSPALSSPLEAEPTANDPELTPSSHSDRMNGFSRRLSSWLSGLPGKTGKPVTGVPAGGRGRAESPLLDLVRTGIENDFEQVVFPEHPELREVKRVLERSGAIYASLSGSGSALYGLFPTRKAAELTAARLRKKGIPAQATATMTRQQYRRKFLIVDF